jgi:hypothetical protein
MLTEFKPIGGMFGRECCCECVTVGSVFFCVHMTVVHTIDSLYHRVDRVLRFFSSRWNWAPPPLHPPASVPPPSLVRGRGGGGDTLGCGEGVGGVPIPTRGHTVVSIYVCTL